MKGDEIHLFFIEQPLVTLLGTETFLFGIEDDRAAPWPVRLCISPDLVRAPQDEDLGVCVCQEESKRPIHARTWKTPRGESTEELAKSTSHIVCVF